MELKEYIKNDNPFYLHRSKDYDIKLKEGITVFVDEFGKTFHDMTFIQYAIASRKPKCLKDMLETSYYQCQIPFKNIIEPETSNTKGNILSLAIEFGSINSHYEDVNLSCLEVIINFGKNAKEKNNEDFNIDIENINGETPLIRAINYKNTEACKLLIQNGANIFHQSVKNRFLKSPLWHLFVRADNISILQKVINRDFLQDDLYNQCKEEMKSENFYNFFIKDAKNNIPKEFCDFLFSNEERIKPDFNKDSKSANNESKTSGAQSEDKDKNICPLCKGPLKDGKSHITDDGIICDACYEKMQSNL